RLVPRARAHVRVAEVQARRIALRMMLERPAEMLAGPLPVVGGEPAPADLHLQLREARRDLRVVARARLREHLVGALLLAGLLVELDEQQRDARVLPVEAERLLEILDGLAHPSRAPVVEREV